MFDVESGVVPLPVQPTVVLRGTQPPPPVVLDLISGELRETRATHRVVLWCKIGNGGCDSLETLEKNMF